MCFNKEWSIFSFLICIGAVVLSVEKNLSWRYWVPILYLSLMELFQAIQYDYLLTCSKENKFLAILEWIHISFGPLFINLFFSGASENPDQYNIILILCAI